MWTGSGLLLVLIRVRSDRGTLKMKVDRMSILYHSTLQSEAVRALPITPCLHSPSVACVCDMAAHGCRSDGSGRSGRAERLASFRTMPRLYRMRRRRSVGAYRTHRDCAKVKPYTSISPPLYAICIWSVRACVDTLGSSDDRLYKR